MNLGQKVLVCCTLLGSIQVSAQEDPIRFAEDIWPILAERCIQCHGESEQEGDLRLDAPEFIRKGGEFGPILDQSDPSASTLLELVMLPEGDSDRMPNKGEPLSETQITVLQKWVKAGAPFDGWTLELQAEANAEVAKNNIEPDWATVIPQKKELPIQPVTFNKDVRQILSDNCYKCHGPDQNTRKAKLRFDFEADAIADRDGHPAIVPGDLLNSELVKRIFHPNLDERMPPEESEKVLSEEEKQTLAVWIQQGGKYESHWVYEPITKPSLAGTEQNTNPIDLFISGELKKHDLDFSPKADAYTLARRLSYDLTGMPATVQQAERLIENENASALIDQLVGSPQYGEKMAIHWLDVVRYADSNGYHSDEERTIWPYRDYVINAFNNNKPFDEFTREQLAGDLIEGASQEQMVASGFNRLNQITAEGGAQPKEYRAIYNSDRVRSIGTVWMGLTLGCAQCHSHKFDPVTHKDFYSMAAFFSDVEETDVYPGRSGWAPFMRLPDDAHRSAMKEIDRDIESIQTLLNTSSTESSNEQKTWLKALKKAEQSSRNGWIPIRPEKILSEKGTDFSITPDLSMFSSQLKPVDDTFTYSLRTQLDKVSAVRLELLAHPEFKKALARRKDTDYRGTVEIFLKTSGADDLIPIPLSETDSTVKIEKSSSKIEDGSAFTQEKLKYRVSEDKLREDVQIIFKFKEPVVPEEGSELVFKLTHSTSAQAIWSPFARVRLSLSSSSIPSVRDKTEAPEFITRLLASNRPKSLLENEAVTGYFRSISESRAEDRKKIEESYTRRRKELNAVPTTLITRALSKKREVRILPRGNWMDESGPIVGPAVPEFLPALNLTGGEGIPNRLDLANWITHKENPLTARVVMNRLWKQFFGRGLSSVLDDLGSQGEWPTHPELLDWLSSEFIESGWDMKHMVRLITTSDTYQQASNVSPKKWDADPANKWYSRQSSYRVEAEGVRDIALALSGLLNTETGGPSGRPYQPAGYWQHLNFPKRTYAHDDNLNQYRRGLYVHWQRSFLHPSMMAFDAPSREECVAQRVSSNTPLQALALMNDPTYVEAARAFAERIMREGGDTFDKKLTWALRQAVLRTPAQSEIKIMKEIYTAHEKQYKNDKGLTQQVFSTGMYRTPEDLNLAELAAWTSVARVIFNLHETITRS